MSELTQIRRDIEWYREGERDGDFVEHLADELLAHIIELEAAANTAICIFCGETMAKNPTVMLKHAEGCEKRPENNLLKRVQRAEAERNKANDVLDGNFSEYQDMSRRLEQAEAERAEYVRLYESQNGAMMEVQSKLTEAEAALAERDRMLQSAYELENLPAEWAPDEYAMWVDTLREQVRLQEENVRGDRPICPEVDEFTCNECSGHNRCEEEMIAGFGEYDRDDPREDR